MSEGNGNLPVAPLRGQIRANGIDFPENTSFEEWERTGQVLLWLHSWTPWALADWLNFGERKWGKTYTQAAAITGKAIKTLYNTSYLGREFPVEEGLRSEVLTPGHHEVLSGFDPEDKRYWLKEGERLEKESNGHLTVKAFREHVREHRRELPGAKTERVEPPPKCSECFGSGKCASCHGSGESPVNGKKG